MSELQDKLDDAIDKIEAAAVEYNRRMEAVRSAVNIWNETVKDYGTLIQPIISEQSNLQKKCDGLKESLMQRTQALAEANVKARENNQRIRGLETMLKEAEQKLGDARMAIEQNRMSRDELLEQKGAAYNERNRLVALLAGIYPSWKGIDDKWNGTDFETVVYVNLPTGQASWHIPKWDLHLFEHVDFGTKGSVSSNYGYDGHTTDEKYDRVQKLINRLLANKLADDAWRKPACIPGANDIV